MQKVFGALLRDESGFIVSAELVLIATLLVIGLIVGLSEVQHAVVEELNDVGDAIGSLNQSYYFSGFSAKKNGGHLKSSVAGASFVDAVDSCDNNQCEIACNPPTAEGRKGGHGGGKY
ncbi:Flp family type IVb pilin [Planctomicrobium sp. SH668]|uniref:Flp family type IVb pilin n=1 Tax=Planctomicrobium sp. SH668 TaxID=3448126 RepID=UPI003F5BEB36